jgi:hypothetical protein
MSRFLLASLALSAVSSMASAQAASPDHFAEPPHAASLTPDRSTVRAALATARARNLAEFRAYQQRGVFPSNTFADRKLNVWRDTDGHLCAAATIIDHSGQHELVQRIADQSNFIRLGDVDRGPLMDWMLTSGFTQQEIAAIQEPFMPVAEPAVEPATPQIVDARRRSDEDRRLRSRYVVITRQLERDETRSLDVATDRLLAHPQLALALVNRAHHADDTASVPQTRL